MEELERLTESEALALAGLLRLLIRGDGRFTDSERDALSLVAVSVGQIAETTPAGEPYRGTEPSTEPLGEERLYALIERAGEALVDEAAIRAAALGVTRPAARAAIHALLFEVAAADMISSGESSLLDWLFEVWELEPPQELEGEDTNAG